MSVVYSVEDLWCHRLTERLVYGVFAVSLVNSVIGLRCWCLQYYRFTFSVIDLQCHWVTVKYKRYGQ